MCAAFCAFFTGTRVSQQPNGINARRNSIFTVISFSGGLRGSTHARFLLSPSAPSNTLIHAMMEQRAENNRETLNFFRAIFSFRENGIWKLVNYVEYNFLIFLFKVSLFFGGRTREERGERIVFGKLTRHLENSWNLIFATMSLRVKKISFCISDLFLTCAISRYEFEMSLD